MTVLEFAILGLGAGATYGLIGQGVVLVYRSSGVLNFAQGAFGMVGAFAFYLSRQNGVPTLLCFVIAIAIGAALGAATHLLVMRPLRSAPSLARLVATLAILTVCLALGEQLWGFDPVVVTPLLPSFSIHLTSTLYIGADRLTITCVALGVTALLYVTYRFTQFGLASRAVAESRQVIAAQGVAPDAIATLNWTAGGVLAVIGAILIVNISGLAVEDLTLLIVPALAACLIGGFASFVWTMAGGFLIGILQSEIVYYQVLHGSSPTLQGASQSVPFLIIIAVLVVRGRALPLRGEPFERPPHLGSGRLNLRWLIGLIIAGAVLASAGPADWVNALTMTAGMAIVLLSIVVVTGYSGQLSLAQFSLAGFGAWIATELVVNAHLPFFVAVVLAILGTIPVGLVIGLPALRTRGVNLAIATFGFALLLESEILANQARTGGDLGLTVKNLSILGIPINQEQYPTRYVYFALVCLLLATLVVANVRRGRSGRRLIAIRQHERAAATLGTSVLGAKLYAFGFGAGLAALGGIVIAFQQSNIVFYPTFASIQSIFVVIYAVLGGVGSVVGALIGAVLSPDSLGAQVFSTFGSSVQQFFLVFGGLLLLVTLIANPNGLVEIGARYVDAIDRRILGGNLARRKAARAVPVELDEDIPEVGVVSDESIRFTVENLTVRFGGVTALNDVSLELRSGEVLGLIGPNGAGKTTFVDASTGLVRATGGRILLNGQDITRWSARRRAIAGMGRSFQGLELFESLTVEENLLAACDDHGKTAYFRDLVHPGRADLSPAARKAVRDFRLEPYLGDRVDSLPFGRRRLVAIACAIASDPRILLIDEPAAGLDLVERRELVVLIRRLAKEWNLAVLVIEHDVSLVVEVSDRVAVLDLGKKIAEEIPEAILRDPKVLHSYLGGDEGHAQAPPPVVTATETLAVRSAAASDSDSVVLQATGLTAGYDELIAIWDVDLSVKKGKISVLLGPNGAGKTTTLLALSGELPLRRGQVDMLGELRSDPFYRRVRAGLGYVPEERAIAMSMSVLDNLRLGHGDVDRALELFPELERLLHQRAGLCSGGEQQMLSLARAMARQPQVLLIDELSLGLAPLAVARLLAAVRTAADDGLGVLLVEQHLESALNIADHVYMIRQGHVVLNGPAGEIRTQMDQLESAYFWDTSMTAAPASREVGATTGT